MVSTEGRSDRFSRGLGASIWITVLVGLVVTAAWLATSDLHALLETAARIHWRWLLLLPVLTVASILIRFLRWNFMLRRIGAYTPLRENLRVFVGAFAFIVTPLHLGEIAKAGWLRRHSGLRWRHALGLLLVERSMDFLSLLTIGFLLLLGIGPGLLLAGILGVLLLLALLLAGAHPSSQVGGHEGVNSPPEPPIKSWRSWPLGIRIESLSMVFFLSLLSWFTASLTLAVALAAIGIDSDLARTSSIFSLATPLGGVTLVPGGVGITGSVMLVQLERALALERADAALAIILVRLGTFWLAAGLGTICLFGLVRARASSVLTSSAHFDAIARHYEEEIPRHVRDRILRKKVCAMEHRLGTPGPGYGLDIGCGQGWYVRALEERGHRLVGLDRSIGQLQALRAAEVQRNGRRIQGVLADAGAIPLATGSVDFVVCVNVLHHILSRAEQGRALDEIARVLRPGGCLFLHEINVLNPLFRFYMGYIFPLLRRIDLGNEKWLVPNGLPELHGLRLEAVDYFTFLPDFLPRPVVRWLLPAERWLERSRLRCWSAHFMAVYRRGAGTGPSIDGTTPGSFPLEEESSVDRKHVTIAGQ